MTTEAPVTEVLARAFSRVEEQFYDDIVLTTPEGRFLGFIEMRALVILPNRLLWEPMHIMMIVIEKGAIAPSRLIQS